MNSTLDLPKSTESPLASIANFADLAKCSRHVCVIDTETTGLDWWVNHIIGVGFYCPDLEGSGRVSGYVPCLTEEERNTAYEIVNLFAPTTTVICHNVKFDMHMLKVSMLDKAWTFVDTTYLVHHYDSRLSKALVNAEQYFVGSDSKRQHIENANAGAKKKKDVWTWPLEQVAPYCVDDCIATYQLAQKLLPVIRALGSEPVFWKDMDYLHELHWAERTGFMLDNKFIAQAQVTMSNHEAELAQQLYDSVGYEFNWRSPQQLSKAIYTDMGIPKPINPFLSSDGIDHSRFADAGKYRSTCTSTFILIDKVHHPLGSLVAAVREANKFQNYLKKWVELEDDMFRVHTNFNGTATRTGRISSSKPNIQNVPSYVKGHALISTAGRKGDYNLRRAFVAPPGKVLLSIDYKQMEMRMFGLLSQDPFMLSSLVAGRDVHMDIALRVWGDCGAVTNKMHREWSKMISFGLIYGMTVGSLMYKLDMSKSRAIEVTSQYWKEFPRVKPWMNEIISECQHNHILRNWAGRIWREEVDIDCYKGCNALIQGGCFDLLSVAAIRAGEWCRARSSDHKGISYVHDEIIIELPEEDILPAARELTEIMQVPDLMGIPFMTEAKVGHSYGTQVEIPKDAMTDKNSKWTIPADELTLSAQQDVSSAVEKAFGIDEDEDEEE